jgi:hypothetical protein
MFEFKLKFQVEIKDNFVSSNLSLKLNLKKKNERM